MSLFKPKVKFTRFLFLSLILLWCYGVEASPVSKVENLTFDAKESEPSDTLELQFAKRESGLPEIPFAARKRKKPEGDIRIGRFEIHPGAGLAYRFNDNIFLNADQSFSNGSFESTTSDSIAILTGTLNVSKELRLGDTWGFDMTYGARNESFVKNGDQDFLQHDLDTSFSLAGQGGRTKITFFGNYLDTIDPFSSEFASNFNPRSERTLTELGERFRWAITPRTIWNLNGKISFQRFDASTLQGEDRNNINFSTSLLWSWTTLTSFGLNLFFDNTLYTAPQSLNNDSNLYGFFAIARFEPSAFISGDVGIGYQERHIAGGIESRGGFSYKMNLKYDYSDRTKFFLSGERGIQDSTFLVTNVSTRTIINLAWEQQWPLLPKLGTRVFAGYQNLDFSEGQADTINGGGVEKNRNDDLTTVGIDFIYSIQKWLDVELEYKRVENEVNFEQFNYLNNVLTLSVKTVF